jgi:hypothetical protein
MKQTIKHFALHPARLLAGACCLLTMFTLAAAGYAQQAAQGQGSKAMVAASTTPAARPAAAQKPGSEGLKVHGHWKIEVKNPDGTLARTVKFENALATPGEGDLALVQLLAGMSMAGDWAIVFSDSGWQMCTSGSCNIYQVSNQGPAGQQFTSAPNSFPGLQVIPKNATTVIGASIVLQGSATANMATTIDRVGTMIGQCLLPNSNATLPAGMQSCATMTQGSAFQSSLIGSGVGYFTRQMLSSGVPVVAGQIIQFTVTLSFS